MPRKVPFVPILSVAGAVFATWSVLSVPKVEPAPPAVQPPRAPFADTLAGSGIVEPAAARTTAVSAPFPGLVAEVFVEVGQKVEAGAPLFRLDDRGLRARRFAAEADVAVAEGDARVKAGVVAAREAAVASARAVLRGFPDRPLTLDFVRIEPWIRPKVSLTGAVNERVDTRVLQVVFRLAPTTLPVYVGQQVDVFMEGVPRSAVGGASASPAAGASGMEGPK
jgi:hypothetical protein